MKNKINEKKIRYNKKKPPYATMRDGPDSYLKGNKLVGEDLSLGDVHGAGDEIDFYLNQIDGGEQSDELLQKAEDLIYRFLDQVKEDDFMKDDPQVREIIKRSVKAHILSPSDARSILGENKVSKEQLKIMEGLYNQFYSYCSAYHNENSDRSIKKYYRTQINETFSKFVSEINKEPKLLKYKSVQNLLEDAGYKG